MTQVSPLGPGSEAVPIPQPLPARPVVPEKATPLPLPEPHVVDPASGSAHGQGSPRAQNQAPKPDRAALEEQTRVLNSLFDGLQNNLEFGLFGDTGSLFVKVVDKFSNRVVKVFPPEDFLRLRQRLKDDLGVFLDRKV